MSFTMSNIVKKRTTVKDRIVECHRYINTNLILTSNVKYALNKYIDFRFNKRQNVTFNKNRLEVLVNDLLEYCCDEHIEDITINHIKANEGSILYEIKRAIYYGATKCLYNSDLNNTNYNYNHTNKTPIYFTKLTSEQLKHKPIVQEYFNEV